MVEFIQNLIGNDLWATVIMSFIPLIELKGGIVFARGVGFNFFEAFFLAYIGSTIVFIPIFFLLKPILSMLKKIKWFNRLALKVEDYFKSKADETIEKRKKKGLNKSVSDTFIKRMGVFIFVAIPLPMTGVWTGTAIAAFFDLKFKDAVLPIVLGNLVAGLIISALAALCLHFWTIKVLDYVLYVLFALAVILLAVVIIKILKRKPQETDK